MICPACAVSMDYRGDGRHVCPRCTGEVYVPTPSKAVQLFGGPEKYREAWFRSRQRYMKAMRDPKATERDFWKMGVQTTRWPDPPPDPDPPPKSEPRHRGKEKRRPPRLAG